MKVLPMKVLPALVLAIASVASAAPVVAQAQDLKVGYVRTEVINREADAAKLAKSRLDAEFKKREKDLSDALAQRNADAEKLNRDAPTLSESERNRRQNAILETDRVLDRKKREYQEDLNQRMNEELNSLREKMRRAVKQIVDNEKYDLILADDAAAFASDRIDITKKVITVMNSQK